MTDATPASDKVNEIHDLVSTAVGMNKRTIDNLVKGALEGSPVDHQSLHEAYSNLTQALAALERLDALKNLLP